MKTKINSTLHPTIQPGRKNLSAADEMAAFDQLPPAVRHALNYGPINFEARRAFEIGWMTGDSRRLQKQTLRAIPGWKPLRGDPEPWE